MYYRIIALFNVYFPLLTAIFIKAQTDRQSPVIYCMVNRLLLNCVAVACVKAEFEKNSKGSFKCLASFCVIIIKNVYGQQNVSCSFFFGQ